MNRRHLLASASAAALASVAAPFLSGQEVGVAAKPGTGLDKLQQDCLETCQRCEATCNATLNYCLSHLAKGHATHAACAALLASCQDFCGLSAKIIARASTLMSVACEANAQACDACAAECDKLKSDAQMAACAEQCRACAVACRKMV